MSIRVPPDQTRMEPDQVIDRLLRERPLFHRGTTGQPMSYAVGAEVLRAVAALVKPGMCTLETGAGYSTVVLAAAGGRHTAVIPRQEEADAITAYCRELGIVDGVRFIVEVSQAFLPREAESVADLDLVFIDGAHRFPIPIIDWYYTDARLKVGGVLAVDDIHIPSVAVLYDFLCLEEQWVLERTIKNTAFFRKVGEQVCDVDWTAQKMNASLWRTLQGGRQPSGPRPETVRKRR